MSFDCYIKIDGIPGESTDDKHKGWIEVLSFSHGLQQGTVGSRSAGSAASSGRADHSDFSIVKKLDKASPKLALYCSNGQHIKEITMDICRDSKDRLTFMTYKLSDILVSSYRPGGATGSGDSVPSEEVSFNYSKINWSYTESDKTGKPGGKVEAEWDRSSNKGK